MREPLSVPHVHFPCCRERSGIATRPRWRCKEDMKRAVPICGRAMTILGANGSGSPSKPNGSRPSSGRRSQDQSPGGIEPRVEGASGSTRVTNKRHFAGAGRWHDPSRPQPGSRDYLARRREIPEFNLRAPAQSKSMIVRPYFCTPVQRAFLLGPNIVLEQPALMTVD